MEYSEIEEVDLSNFNSDDIEFDESTLEKEIEIIEKDPEAYVDIILKENKTYRHYINNAALKEELLQYQIKREHAVDEGLPVPQVPNSLGIALIKICENLSRRYNFARYTYRDIMVSNAIEHCHRAVKTFDARRDTSALSYFTRTAWCAMVQVINSEKREHQKKINMVGDIFIKTSIIQETDNAKDFENDSRNSFYNLYSDH